MNEQIDTTIFEAQVSARDGRPFVKMTCLVSGEPVFATQMRPSMVTALGLRAIQSGIEAERDAGLIAFMRDGGATDDQVARMLIGLRDHRQQFDAAEGTMRPLADDDPTELT